LADHFWSGQQLAQALDIGTDRSADTIVQSTLSRISGLIILFQGQRWQTATGVGWWESWQKRRIHHEKCRILRKEVCLESAGEQNGLNWSIDTLSGLVWTVLPDGSIDFLNRGWHQ